jgi:predicted transcriptional regulator
MKVIRKMLLLWQRGLSERQIVQELKISRPSVSRYKERLTSSGKSIEELQGLDDTSLSAIAHPTEQKAREDARSVFIINRKAYYLAELNRTGVTRVLLWQEYIRADPGGYGYAKFCELLAEQMLPDNASFHMTYEPGGADDD